MSNGLILVLGLGAAGIGWMIFKSRQTRAKMEAAKSWPVANGTITKSIVSTRSSTANKVHRVYYWPDIHYSYAVGAQTYEGSRVSFRSVETTNAEVPQEMVARYPVGAAAAIRYNPANPGESTLS